MKRTIALTLSFLWLTACVTLTNPTPLTPTETVPTTPGVSAADNTLTSTSTPPINNSTLLYISGTTHIESKPQSWPNIDAFLNFLQNITAQGLKWSVGADIGWLEGEPRAAELIQASETLGVQWDIHAHNPQERAKAAYLITQLGGHPTSVISGMFVSEFSSIGPQTYQGFTWTPHVLWGGTNCPGHRPGCDDLAAGIWIPLSAEQYTTHDPNGTLIRVGGGSHQLADGLVLAESIANGQYLYPSISFTLMVSPTSLTIVNSNDGLEQITTFANKLEQYSFVHWAYIEETAQAWTKAGKVPSRIE